MPTELFDLPREIRDQIWNHVIDSDKIHEFQCRNRGYHPGHDSIVFPWAGVAGANRRCHKELFDILQHKGRFLRFRVADIRVEHFTIPKLGPVLDSLAGDAFFSKWIKSLLLEEHSHLIDCELEDDLEKYIKSHHAYQVRTLLDSSTAMKQTTHKISLQTVGEQDEHGHTPLVTRMEFDFI